MVYKYTTRAFILLLLAYLFPYALQGQTNTNIGGIVNIYREVTEIISDSCQIRVADADSFSVGDKVLLIQMQGATIFSDNNSTFGNIDQLGDAGKYEINYVCEINSDTITLSLGLNNSYSVSGNVQLIKIPQYDNATVTSTLTAKNWDGTTGGVLAIDIENTLTLNANIDVSGRGFKGGIRANNSSSCSWWTTYSSYFYALGDAEGELKGQGIAIEVFEKECGKGKQANGGGGGNDHNTGGGGGSNYGAGGVGGIRQSGSCSGNHPGIGGASLNYSNSSNRIYLGGGGGAGHDNNLEGTDGANGGGIAFIFAEIITGNSRYIKANGSNSNSSGADGAGGGGGAGVVFLDINQFGTSNLYLEAKGGNGGNSTQGYNSSSHCYGPGGGGGGGVILVTLASLSLNVSTNISGGLHGTTYASSGCSNDHGNSTDGANGNILYNINLYQGSTICTGCVIPLPVTWLTFQTKAISKKVQLDWSVATEENLDHYVVERSVDGNRFDAILKVAPINNGKNIKNYRAIDEEPVFGYNYYRIKNIDKDGKFSYSTVQLVNFRSLIENINFYPNPADPNNEVTFEMDANDEGIANIHILNMLGQLIWNKRVDIKKGINFTKLILPDLPAGVYPVQIHTNDQVHQVKLVIQ